MEVKKRVNFFFFLIFILSLCSLFSSCKNVYRSDKYNYKMEYPDNYNLVTTENIDNYSFVKFFIDNSQADFVIAETEKNKIIYVLTYNTFINLSELEKNRDFYIENIKNQLIPKFGNASFIDLQRNWEKKKSYVSFYFTFEVNGTIYFYSINFVSGRISSTQVIYGISKFEDKNILNNDIRFMINRYSKY